MTKVLRSLMEEKFAVATQQQQYRRAVEVAPELMDALEYVIIGYWQCEEVCGWVDADFVRGQLPDVTPREDCVTRNSYAEMKACLEGWS